MNNETINGVWISNEILDKSTNDKIHFELIFNIGCGRNDFNASATIINNNKPREEVKIPMIWNGNYLQTQSSYFKSGVFIYDNVNDEIFVYSSCCLSPSYFNENNLVAKFKRKK